MSNRQEEEGPEVVGVEIMEPTAIAAMEASTYDVAIATAKKWPRNVTTFLQRARTLIGEDKALAAKMGYAKPQAGEKLFGPSVRLAEVAVLAWGNCVVEVIEEPIGPKDRTAKCYAMVRDLESNVNIRIPRITRITKRDGTRYGDDMIVQAQNAGVSFAYRNAAFRMIPRAFIDVLYREAMAVAAGDVKDMVTARKDMVSAFEKLGVPPDRLYESLGVAGIDDIAIEHIGGMRGLYEDLRAKRLTVDQAFPKTKGQVAEGQAEKAAAVAGAMKDKPKEPDVPTSQPTTALGGTAPKTEGEAQLAAAAAAKKTPKKGAKAAESQPVQPATDKKPASESPWGEDDL
jgi:hypothetical protein